MENISTVGADKPATPNGLVHEEVTKSTSTAMANLSSNSGADQTRNSPAQADRETHPQKGSLAEFIQDVQPQVFCKSVRPLGQMISNTELTQLA